MSFSATVQQLSIETLIRSSEEAKREGMKRCEDNSNEEWQARVLQVIRDICQRQPYFNSDDVDAAMKDYPEQTHSKRAMGPMMIRACKEGLCSDTGTYSKTKNKRAHACPIRTWKSLLI